MATPLRQLQQLDMLLNLAVDAALDLHAGAIEEAQESAEEISVSSIAIRLGILERALLRAGISGVNFGEVLKLDQRIRELENRFSVTHAPTLWREHQGSATREKRTIATPFLLLDGEILEFVLFPDGILSDQGQTLDAVRTQTAHCESLSGAYQQHAEEIVLGSDILYQQGVFSVSDVTESTLENAVSRLANAVLLFYALHIGMCRALIREQESTA